MNNTNASGLDQIDTSVIKLIKAEILPAVTHIVNFSITTGKFPSVWKRTKIVPLHKKDDRLDPKNYRPVAIVPILSKILERVVFNQMIEYLNENHLLHPNHHAYRAQHNTTTALVQMYDSWLQSVESGQLAGVCLLDMSAAFNVVDHELLLQKLSLYGLDDNILCWINSYLSDRSQCVIIEGSLSKLLPVNSGVPQGSILGPLFYTLFTNELPEVIHDQLLQQPHQAGQQDQDERKGPSYHLGDADNGSICCYADDTTLSCAEFSPSALSNKLSEKYKIIAEFMRNNRLKLNDEKNHLLVMDTGQSKPRYAASRMVEIRTPSEIIRPSKTEKLLGCWVSENLKWSEHLMDSEDNLVKSLNMRLGALKKVGKIASFKNRKMLANGIFMSKLSYLIALWGGCGVVLKKCLQIIQNKVARMVTKLDWSTPSKEVLHQVGWLSVNQLIFYHSVLLIFKVKQNQTPVYLHNMFSWSYKYNTRQAEGGTIRLVGKPRLDLNRNSFRWRAANQFNQLPDDIRTSSSLINFKLNAKKWIENNVSFN